MKENKRNFPSWHGCDRLCKSGESYAVYDDRRLKGQSLELLGCSVTGGRILLPADFKL